MIVYIVKIRIEKMNCIFVNSSVRISFFVFSTNEEKMVTDRSLKIVGLFLGRKCKLVVELIINRHYLCFYEK